MKICLACSAGGHLSEMLQLESFYKKHEYFFVTFKRPDTESLAEKEKVCFVQRPARNPLFFLLNFFQSLSVFLKEKPDLIVSTGADAALSACWIARLLGKKIVFIESFCRPFKPGWTGKLVYPIADLFIVQWKQVQKHYPKSVYAGAIFSGSKKIGKEKGIFVSVGTHPQQFDRLLKKIDELAEKGKIREKIFAQTGHSSYVPKNFDSKKFVSLKEFGEKIKKAGIIITHGGEGNIGNALLFGKKIIIVPRLKEFGEHTNDHQLELTDAIAQEKMGIAVYNINELDNALRRIKEFKLPKQKLKGRVVELLEKFAKENVEL